jgi:hypothetical protein
VLFGISFAGLFGLRFIAGTLVRDLAALNRVEMLPWDLWGAQPQPGEQLDPERLNFFDELARVTLDPTPTFMSCEADTTAMRASTCLGPCSMRFSTDPKSS